MQASRTLIASLLGATGSLLWATESSAQPTSYYGPQSGPAPQGYYSQPSTNNDGFQLRGGRLMYGFSIGLGGMSVDEKAVRCTGCTRNPSAVAFSFHIGGMLSERLGLMFEAQANAQTIEQRASSSTLLSQSTAMFAAQYWLTPRLWIKGGIGVAHLGLQNSNSDTQAEIGQGAAVMGAIGYELLANRTYSLDVQGRLIAGSYEGVNLKTSSGTIGLGLNFF